MVRSWLAMPIRTWPSTNVGAPLAWKETKSIGVPILPVAWLVPRRQCSRNSRVHLAAAAGRVGAADPGRRQRAAHAVDGVVVELVELLRRAAPVADVRLVPDLPVPRLHLGAAVLLDAVSRPLVDQLAPFRVVLRRIGPAGEDLVVPGRGRPAMLVRLRLHGELPRHEADLHVRLDAAFEVGVEDPVEIVQS